MNKFQIQIAASRGAGKTWLIEQRILPMLKELGAINISRTEVNEREFLNFEAHLQPYMNDRELPPKIGETK